MSTDIRIPHQKGAWMKNSWETSEETQDNNEEIESQHKEAKICSDQVIELELPGLSQNKVIKTIPKQIPLPVKKTKSVKKKKIQSTSEDDNCQTGYVQRISPKPVDYLDCLYNLLPPEKRPAYLSHGLFK